MWLTVTLPLDAVPGAWLCDTLALRLCVLNVKKKDVVNLKGFGSGMNHEAVMDATRSPMSGKRVVVVDGDWYKPDSFVSAIEHVLERGGVLVLFREATTPDHKVWSTYDEVLRKTSGRALYVIVPPEAKTRAREDVARVPAVTNIADTALGHLTIKTCDPSMILAVGGGETTINEHRVCVHNGNADAWHILDVPRGEEHSALVE